MDYEKEYKKLKAGISKAYLYAQTDSTKAVLENILPELAESEDEKARKWIYDFIRNCPNESFEFYGGVGKKAVLAYLEKQKDLDKMIVVSPEVWDNAISEAYENGKKEGEKQKEPHYTKRNALFDKCVENCDPEVMKSVSDEVDEMLEKEQKLAEHSAKGRRGRIGTTPEHIRKKAENFLSKMEPPYDADDICSAYETGAMENANLSWSEEDEKMLRTIISDGSRGVELDSKQISFLKSLRPSWKPSEEHLSALLAIFNDPNNIGSQTCQLALTDLYEQLKRMM